MLNSIYLLYISTVQEKPIHESTYGVDRSIPGKDSLSFPSSRFCEEGINDGQRLLSGHFSEHEIVAGTLYNHRSLQSKVLGRLQNSLSIHNCILLRPDH